MNWKDIAGTVGAVAPTIGGLLAGKAGSVIGHLVASALGVSDDPKEVAEALAKPGAEEILHGLEINKRAELSALSMALDEAIGGLQVTASGHVNETMQAEGRSEHWFYRSWRPTFGYITGIVFGAQMTVPLILVWVNPDKLALFIEYTAASLVLWTLAFGVMGITVVKRSQDKALHSTTPADSSSAIERVKQLTKEFRNNARSK